MDTGFPLAIVVVVRLHHICQLRVLDLRPRRLRPAAGLSELTYLYMAPCRRVDTPPPMVWSPPQP